MGAFSRARLGVAVLAGLSLLVLGPSAQLARAQGDPVSYTAEWIKGPGANQQTLRIKNTGGFVISEFTFTTDDNGVQFVTINGSPSSCTAGASQNQVSCGNQLGPGQTESVVTTSANPVPVGATGKVVVYNDADVAQPFTATTLSSGCQPEDPQGPGQKDTRPDGEEKAKPLKLTVKAFNQAGRPLHRDSKLVPGEEIVFHVHLKNPNDDPVKGKLGEDIRAFEASGGVPANVEFTHPDKHFSGCNTPRGNEKVCSFKLKAFEAGGVEIEFVVPTPDKNEHIFLVDGDVATHVAFQISDDQLVNAKTVKASVH